MDLGMIKQIITMTRNLIEHYVEDECGSSSYEKFKKMSEKDFLQLFLNTLNNQIDKDIEDIKFNFHTDLIINFDYNNY